MQVKCCEITAVDSKRKLPSEASFFISDREVEQAEDGDLETVVRQKLERKFKTEIEFFTFYLA